MRREDFIHVLQAAANIVDDELVVVGSQAVLGVTQAPPAELLRSMEVDVYPRSDPERAIEIDGAIGEGSRFHQTYGYYAHGVGPETITAPAGWAGRLEKLTVPAIRRGHGETVAWCLSLPDLMLAKLAAERTHDIAFVKTALEAQLVSAEELERGIELMPESAQAPVKKRLDGLKGQILLAEIHSHAEMSEDDAMRFAREAQDEVRRDSSD